VNEHSRPIILNREEQAGILIFILERAVYLLKMSLDSSHWGSHELMGSGQSGQGTSNCQLAILGRHPGPNELLIVPTSVGLSFSAVWSAIFLDNGFA
jgi:hypothetical protein